MLQVSQAHSHAAIGKRCKATADAARNCRAAKFSAVARALWPHKNAFQLAFHAGASERMAAYWLAGKYEPSASAAAAIVAELFGHR